MNGKKIILVLALILPIVIIVMLRMFGKNQFDVEPLYASSLPEVRGCNLDGVTLPYKVPDSVLNKLPFEKDSLVCIHFDPQSEKANAQIQRAVDEFKSDPISITSSNAMTNPMWKECVFFLQEPFDVVMVDRRGIIRGQYKASDRDEMDRMITEITIILKKYN